MNRLLFVALLFVASPAVAQAPAAIPLQGVLTDPGGYPIVGTVKVHFALYESQSAEQALWSETQELTLSDGLFTAYLGADTAIDLALFADHGEMWLGITVEDDPEMTRIALGSAPYAAFAEHCGTVPEHEHSAEDFVGGIPEEALPDTVVSGNQECPEGQVLGGFEVDGTIICVDDKNTEYNGEDFVQSNQECPKGKVLVGFSPMGTMLCEDPPTDVYSGEDFAMSNQLCNGTDKVTGISPDGALNCAADEGQTYTGNDFATSGQKCGNGEVVKSINAQGKIVCGPISGADISGKTMLYIQHADCGGSQVPTTAATCKSNKCSIGGWVNGYLNCAGVCAIVAQPSDCDNSPLGYLISP